MRVLVVCKDLGPSKMMIPLAALMRERGDFVEVMTEGLATAEFKKAGFEPSFSGSVNRAEEPYEVSQETALHMIRSLNPHVVVTASGSPIYLEKVVAKAVIGGHFNTYPFPYLVAMEDFWGGASRLDVMPDLLLCLDAYAEELGRNRHRDNVATCIVGNHGVLKSLVPSPEAREFIENLHLRFNYVFCFLGGGIDYTSAEIRMLVASLEKTTFVVYDPLTLEEIKKPTWCLIPRLHPKLKDTKHPSGKTWGEVWRSELSALGDRVVWADHLKTEDVAMLAGASFGGFSTVLTTAVAAGKGAVSLWPPETRNSLKNQTGLEQVPLVALGCAEQITEPCSLHQLVEWKPSAEAFRKLKPYDPEVAYRAIKELVESGKR